MISSRKCPRCGFQHGESFYECPRCGVVLFKYARRDTSTRPRGWGISDPHSPASRLWAILLRPPKMSRFGWPARVLLVVLLGFWCLAPAVGAPTAGLAGESVLHWISSAFHRAGSAIFSPFGKLPGALGGTLLQLLVPLGCGAALLWRRRATFGAAVCLWWFGKNLLDIAPHIHDVGSGALPLLGAATGRESPYGRHDWDFLLSELDLLGLGHSLALASHLIGALLMGLGIFWCILLLLRHAPTGRPA